MAKTAKLWFPRRVIVVGLGGTGTHLIHTLARYLANRRDAPKEMILIDGDVYSEENLERQLVLAGDVGQHKAKTWAQALAAEFTQLEVIGHYVYIGPRNIQMLPLEKSVIFLCVDNHATRKLFSDECARVRNVSLIVAGNEKEDGSVIHYLRANGVDLTPPPTAYHPEIAYPRDQNPAELSCDELAKLEGGEQVIWANMTAAGVMGNVFYMFLTGSAELASRYAEWYFDIRRGAVRPAIRLVPRKEVSKEEKTTPASEAVTAKVDNQGAMAPEPTLETVRETLIDRPADTPP